MKAVIIGYPYSGKTTFFDALAGAETKDEHKCSNSIRNIKVKDLRLEKLRDIYSPKKYSPAEINVVDTYVSISDYTKDNSLYNSNIRDAINKSELTVILVRAFSAEKAPYFKEKIEPLTDLKNLVEEMCFTDLIAVEKRIERLKKENTKGMITEVFNRCYESLQNNVPVYQLELSEEELASLSGFRFLTQNKIMAVINADDYCSLDLIKNINDYCEKLSISVLQINAEIEKEINLLDSEEDKIEFLREYNIDGIICDKFVKQIFDMMNLISFFTCGKDEVKAWPVKKDIKAVKAAGKIHSDIERGFIRAEIVNYSVYEEHGFDWNKLKNEGKLRLEGKEYTVKDADIINFRFNV